MGMESEPSPLEGAALSSLHVSVAGALQLGARHRKRSLRPGAVPKKVATEFKLRGGRHWGRGM